MRVEEAKTGARVRVGGHRVPHLSGLLGTIKRTYRSPSERTALHVQLDDGRWQLLWPHEVELLGEGPQRGDSGGS